MPCRIDTARTDPTLVRVVGEVDMAESADLAAALRDPIEQGHDVVVDMRRVRFIDCTGIRTLQAATDLARRRGHRLVVCPSPAVTRIVQLVASTRRKVRDHNGARTIQET